MALKKLSIVAYSDEKYSAKTGSYDLLINPDTYTHNYSIHYNDSAAPGSPGALMKFERIGEETVSFKITFDGTGVVPGAPKEGVTTTSVKTTIDDFRNLVFKYNGRLHEPNYLKLVWGTLAFECRLKTLNLKYVLFTPEGEPVRAEADVLFSGYTAASEAAQEAKKSSADMSHLVTVKAGDTLPLLCYRIYGTSLPYAQVARVNGLTGFRRIEPGTELLFPPIRNQP
jgi:nucleoid-associated protein YgaU